MTWQQRRITGRQLAHRSRGVTTLHHYERISSRDLEWHRRNSRREKGEVKTIEEVKPYREKNTTEINVVESTPVGKRNKELQIRTTLRMKRDERLDKMKELE